MKFGLSLPRFWRRFIATILFAGLIIWSYAPSGKTSPKDGNPREIAVAQSTPLPFDLVTVDRDMNRLPLNPKWGAQVNFPGTFPNPLDYKKCPNADFSGPQCSSSNQIKWINKATYNAPICVWGGAGSKRVNGHVNWTAATYTGSICWGGPSLDGDYDWSLKPDNGAGLTVENDPRPTVQGAPKNPQYIHVEFNTEETTDAFRSPLWTKFRRYLDPVCSGATYTCDEAKGRAMVDGRRAIVTGLLGLDSEHGGYSELHPVYAMAVQTQADSADNDNWMIFARNWGDEGYCSGAIESLPPELSSVKILVPQPESTAEITGVDITSDFYSYDTDDCPTATFIKNKGVLLTFNAPKFDPFTAPVRRPIIEGEVHLRWHTTGTIQPATVVPCHPQVRQQFLEDQKELEKSLKGRVLKMKERFEFFQLERQQISDLFHPGTLLHCIALTGAVPAMNPSGPDLASLTASGTNAVPTKPAVLPAKKKSASYLARKQERMRRALNLATRKKVH